jgi:hypothetical protein
MSCRKLPNGEALCSGAIPAARVDEPPTLFKCPYSARSRKVDTTFRKRSCSNKDVERDNDSTKHHPALVIRREKLPVKPGDLLRPAWFDRLECATAPAGTTRLQELSFGEWEGLTYADVLKRDAEVIIERERDKWGFLPPGGESYAQLTDRVAQWHRTIDADTVVAAHGGTGRALMAHLAVVPPDEAPHYPLDQGVVYVFADNRITRVE